MRNTASLENSKRLYELSKWGNDFDDIGKIPYYWRASKDKGVLKRLESDVVLAEFYGKLLYTCPAYDAGYLLRKLPRGTMVRHNDYDGSYSAMIAAKKSLENSAEHLTADTPEDALCLLAIKLFEEGVS